MLTSIFCLVNDRFSTNDRICTFCDTTTRNNASLHVRLNDHISDDEGIYYLCIPFAQVHRAILSNPQTHTCHTCKMPYTKIQSHKIIKKEAILLLQKRRAYEDKLAQELAKIQLRDLLDSMSEIRIGSGLYLHWHDSLQPFVGYIDSDFKIKSWLVTATGWIHYSYDSPSDWIQNITAHMQSNPETVNLARTRKSGSWSLITLEKDAKSTNIHQLRMKCVERKLKSKSSGGIRL